jgi:hypothetical protein
MSEFLYHYHPVEPATWFYLSSLLTIGLFFKFSRFWSVRNLDLMLLILLGPGLLFIHYGRKLDQPVVSPSEPARAAGSSVAAEPRPATHDGAAATSGGNISPATVAVPVPPEAPGAAESAPSAAGEAAEVALDDRSETDDPEPLTRGRQVQKYGYLWLFCVGGLLLARLLADPTMVRRPLLEPNLSAGGLTFIGCSLFVFLMANVISRPANETATSDPVAVEGNGAEQVVESTASKPRIDDIEGPGYALLASLPSPAKKSLVILAHLTVAVGMVLIGYRHFDNIVMGVGAATLYLMLPYTALMTNEIKHVLPAASLVWAVLCYRRPLAAGMFLGLAGGMTYYPLFLLPLWLSFYWPRGLLRFLMGVLTMLLLLLFVLFSSADVVHNVRLMFGLLPPAMNDLRGIWDESLGGWSSYYRIPVLAAFVALASSLALWPAQKNLGTLLSCSAAVMVATQFWHGYGGGEYMAWYLPLMLLTIFRPNLEDRVALTVLAEGWLPRRISVLPADKAAFSALG